MQLPQNIILRVETTLIPKLCLLKGDAARPGNSFMLEKGKKKGLDFVHHSSSFMQVCLVHQGNCLGAINPCVKIAL